MENLNLRYRVILYQNRYYPQKSLGFGVWSNIGQKDSQPDLNFLEKEQAIKWVKENIEVIVWTQDDIGSKTDLSLVKDDIEHLQFISDRLIYQHKEDPNIGYMLKLERIIAQLRADLKEDND